MYIKNSPVKGFKTDFAGFELDASKIELHSVNNGKIQLPYSGPLPDALQDNDGAVISIMITVNMKINLSLIVAKGEKKTCCRIVATPQEINDILFPFFFQDKGNDTYHTNWDCGLTRYWLGNYQSSYTHWRRFVVEGCGVDDLIGQLSPMALERLEKYVEHRHTKTA